MKKIIGLLLVVAVMLFATIAKADHTVGDELMGQGKYADAEAAYRVAVADAKTIVDRFSAQLGIGTSLLSQKKYEEATVEYTKAEKLVGITVVQKAEALTHEGYVLQHQGNFTGQLAKMDVVLALDGILGSQQGIAQERKGVAYLNLNSRENAVTEFEKVLLIKGVNPVQVVSALEGAGNAYVELNKISEAQASYMACAIKGAPIYALKSTFNKVDPSIIGTAKYVEYLGKLLIVLPFTENNTTEENEFIKSVKMMIEKYR